MCFVAQVCNSFKYETMSTLGNKQKQTREDILVNEGKFCVTMYVSQCVISRSLYVSILRAEITYLKIFAMMLTYPKTKTINSLGK